MALLRKTIERILVYLVYTFEHYNPHKVRIVFNCNVTDKSINTHALRANLNVHRCISHSI
jgi:hypothetical protein